MMKLEYEKNKEKYEDENEKIIETEIINITAETNHPQTKIIFLTDDEHLATTITDTTGKASCGFSPKNKAITIKATCDEETATLKIPKKI